MKFSFWIGGVVLLIVALWGHWYYWYSPRTRTGSPGGGTTTSQVFFGGSDLPLRLWIPFPHQNLAALERSVGDLEGVSEISSYLMSRDLASLPSFGPFRLPPARDLVIAGSPGGDRVVVAANVYPVVARLARLAGRLAGNAWLAGGTVQLHDSTVEVEWREGTWLAVQGDSVGREGGPVPDLVPSHALVKLNRPFGPVPEGLFRLDLEADGWSVVNAEPPAKKASDARPRTALPSGLALVAASTAPGSPPDSVTRTFVMLAEAGQVGDPLSRSVIAHRGSGQRWQLPAESLLSGLGFEVTETSRDGWSLAAYEEAALHEVEARLGSISELLASVDESPVELGIWMDLAEARGALEGLVRALSALPLPMSEQLRLWTIAANSLASLDPSGSLSLWIAGSPPRLELTLLSSDSD